MVWTFNPDETLIKITSEDQANSFNTVKNSIISATKENCQIPDVSYTGTVNILKISDLLQKCKSMLQIYINFNAKVESKYYVNADKTYLILSSDYNFLNKLGVGGSTMFIKMEGTN